MTMTLRAAACVFLFAGPALADGLIVKPSAHGVGQTADRLSAAVEAAGATVFARIDHGAGAAAAGFELPDAVVVIFGNPKLGQPVMSRNLRAGLDLPLRVLIAETPEGGVEIVYRDPSDLLAPHGLGDAPVTAKMRGALDKLTSKAGAGDSN